MALLPNFIARRLDFEAPMEVPPTKFSFDQNNINQWKAKLQYTPDASLLSQNKMQHIFVYDRLMEKRDDFESIIEAVLPIASIGYTVHRFCNWRKNLGKLSFPIPLETRESPTNPPWADLARETSWFRDAPPAIVKGIVYSIDSDKFKELDKLYRNGLYFDRKKVKIQIPYIAQIENGGKEYLMKLWAWMYVGRKEHWEDQLDAGMFFTPVKINPPDLPSLSEYSFFDQPTGEPPTEEPKVVIKRLTQKSFPLYEGKEVVGSGFEHVEIEVPSEPNPYKSQIDGASPVQRTIAESE